MAPCKSLSGNTSLSALLSSLAFHHICPRGGFKRGTAGREVVCEPLNLRQMKAEGEKKQRDDQKDAEVGETLDVGTAGH